MCSVSNHKLITRKRHKNIDNNEMNTIHDYLYIFSFRVYQESLHVKNILRNNNVSLIVYITKTIDILLIYSDKRNQLILMTVN